MSPFRRLFIPIGLAVVLLSGSGVQAASIKLKGKEVHPTHIIAKLKAKGAAAKGQANIVAAQGLTSTAESQLVPGLVLLDTDPATAGAAAKAAPIDQAVQLQSRIEALRQSGLYEYVEPDYIVHAVDLPTDSRFADGTLWGLHNTGQSNGIAGVDVGVTNAWDVTTGSTNIIIAVIDSGIRYTHQDLAAQMWHVNGIFGTNAVAGTTNPMDDNDHGTHVAGTIGAAGNDGHPIVGVCRKVRLMACKFLGSDGTGTTFNAIECIEFAVAHGAKILNNSWGGSGGGFALQNAISAAGDQGVLFVAAAGNDGADNDASDFFPANYQLDNIISVAAIDRRDRLASFSNYGRTKVHLGAPGVEILSSTSGSDTEYQFFDGTSMATPHVSGVAGLVLSQFPDLSVQDLRARLLNTVVVTAALLNTTTTGGRVNAYQALTAAPTGTLTEVLSAETGDPLLAGRLTSFFVRVNDLTSITNATVTANAPGIGDFSFVNDGTGADQTAHDGTYSAAFTVPTNANSITITVVASASGKIGVTNDFTFDIIPPPANDNFTDRISLSGTALTTTGSSIGATRESGEPVVANNNGGRSVWWTWTAPASGQVTITTANSSFDTILGVFTGASLNTLSQVATNDDVSSGHLTSSVTFQTSAGTAYQIVVDGYDGANGSVALNLSFNGAVPTPTNDNFARRILISGGSNVVTGSNIGASQETGEPAHAGRDGGVSVWWTWTAPANGILTVSTAGSSFDTLLGIYTGSAVNALTEVASNDDDVPLHTSLASFPVTAGTNYQIAVDGYNGANGSITLSVNFTGAQPTPANDNFANAIIISGISNTVTGTNFGATLETGEPKHDGQTDGASVWWNWTAPITGTANISLAGSDFDTLLAVYTGNTVRSLTGVASNTTAVTFQAVAKKTYHIAVAGLFGAEGNIVLNVKVDAIPPNDSFAHRIALTGMFKTVLGTNIAATHEANENDHADYPGGGSVWWSWTAPSNGLVTVATSDATFNTLLEVYTGTSVGHLTPVTADPGTAGDGNSLATFTATAHTVYQIAVDGKFGAMGTFALSVGLAPPNDLFAKRTVFSGGSNVLSGYNFSGSHEAGEPMHAGGSGGASVWWSWTAPSNGVAVFSTDGSSFDTLLGVYTGSSVDALFPVVSNDDDLTGSNSTVTLSVSNGVTYQIAVDGANNAFGSIKLSSRLFTAGAAITNQPASVRVTTNAAAKLTVAATGTKPLSYQWFQDGNPVNGATNSVLSFVHTALTNSGDYTVVVGNPAGTVTSSTATLSVVNETVLPIVTITDGPAANARVTFPTTSFFGKASDSKEVDRIVATQNGADATNVAGTTVWSATVTNVPGTNTFVVKAVDVNTNESLPVTRKYFYSVTKGLTLLTNLPGMGTITKNFTTTNLEIGRGYTMTAVAKPGFVFSNWSGTITTNKATLNFLMQSNMVLQANFVTNPFIAIKGVYNGLFADSGPGIPDHSRPNSGFFTFTLKDDGTYSGKIFLTGTNHSFTGSFDLNGFSTAAFTLPGMGVYSGVIQIGLALNLAAPDDTVIIGITNAYREAAGSGDRAVFNTTTAKATNFMGNFTLAIPGATIAADEVGGSGYGTLTIDASGTIKFAGKLGEGTSVSQSVTISKDGRWPFYATLYGGKGSIMGWLNFTNQPATTFGGDLFWDKPVLATALYPLSFFQTNAAIGSVFKTPTVSTTAVVDIGNGTLILSGGNLNNALTNNATVNPTSVIVSGTNHVTLTVNRASGLLSGSFTHPDLKKAVLLNGVILQQQNLGYGYFLGTNQSGTLLLQGNE